ncbi:hypothetical protein GWI33_022032 [Rhynchophorus ferrugineus]|uniref:Ionotropic receptor n=1 Tax=Rhynchophorus ferrugineus TaxID=354439 RepID=A0A834HU84_RHYFE|nr:hypothetical protein GWI33_022032 [Rhynchophorus ferrugineus]
MIVSLILENEQNALIAGTKLQLLLEKEKVIYQLRVANFGIYMMKRTPIIEDMISIWFQRKIFHRIPRINVGNFNKIRLRNVFTHLLVFTDNVSDITHNMQKLIKRFNLLYSETRYIFLIITNEGSLNATSYIWDNFWRKCQISNYIFFIIGQYSELLSYNPFTRTVFNLTDLDFVEPFPDKLVNLHGYQLNVSVMINLPGFREIDGGFSGVDYELVSKFVSTRNATCKIIVHKGLFDSTMADIIEGEGDIIGNGFFAFEGLMLQSAYPHGFMDIVILVKDQDGGSLLMNLMFMFDKYTCLALCLVLAMYYILKRTIWTGGHSSSRILRVAFLFFVFIMMTIFQSWIIRVLITSEHTRDLNTLDDLIKSGLPLYCLNEWKVLIHPSLIPHVKAISYADITTRLSMHAAQGAFCITSQFSKSIKTDKDLRDINAFYHEMREHAGTAFLVFYLRRNSPYKKKLKYTVLRSLQYGLYSREFGSLRKAEMETRRVAEELKLPHFTAVFELFGFGLFLSLVIFVLECIV